MDGVCQLSGFLFNAGDVDACHVKLHPVNSTGKVLDFWPDWAPNAQYEVFFNPKQVGRQARTHPPA